MNEARQRAPSPSPGRADSWISVGRGGPRAVAEMYSAGAAHVGLVQWARVGGGERVCLVGAVERRVLAEQKGEVVGTHLGVPRVGLRLLRTRRQLALHLRRTGHPAKP